MSNWFYACHKLVLRSTCAKSFIIVIIELTCKGMGT